MNDEPVIDEIKIGTAASLLGRRSGEPAPYACCPRDGEPLVSTFEFRGAEFVCMVCGTKYGFLSPTPRTPTPELEARHTELHEQYLRERRQRETQEVGP